MQEIYLHDAGGIEPDASDICTDELVTMLDGVNTTLGTKDDPRFGEYQEFLSSIDEASILKIEPDQISSGKYDGLDLTGDEDSADSIVVKEPKESDFFPNSFDEFVKTACFITLCTQGTVYEKGYAAIPDSAFMLPKYQTA